MRTHQMSPAQSEEVITKLLEVCYSHYIYNETQVQIAEKMGVSKAKICKMIAKAKALGLFTITVNDPIQASEALSEKLVARFSLRKVVVVPMLRYGLGNIIKQLGEAGSTLLAGVVSHHDVVGISGGAALYEMVKAFPTLPVHEVTIVPLLSGYTETEASTRGTEIAYILSEKLGARTANIPIPGLASSPEEALVFRENPIVKNSMSLIRRCNIGVFGIGTANRDASLYKGGFLDDQLLSELQREKAIGCIGFSFYDADGNPCIEFNARNIGWSLDDIKQIPMAIGVSGGNLDKAKAVRGALLGRYIDTLVTDKITAEYLLDNS
ncbi:MAG: hypothetical protein LUC93_08175 [Planctomycetaceae bacterium]|nr:hypothetical protein [Planctomycetaceae bacterium]